ncbi:MAG: phosphatidate cytidylyltransferase [Clostridia bacterium]|nr:phosphatidate cytidylyltransferase [Clostridia bacterium]
MKKRLYSGAIFVAILAVAFVLKATVSNYFFDALILAIACISSLEFSKMLTKMGKFNNKILATVQPCALMLALLLCIAYQSSISLIFTILIAIAVVVVFTIAAFLWSVFTAKKTKREMETRKISYGLSKFALIKAVNTLIVYLYPAFLMMFLTLINHMGDLTATFTALGETGGLVSVIVLIFAFLIPIFSDTFAYLVGGLVGGRKLAPKISPNKTVSGAVGGGVFCVLLSIVLLVILNAIPATAVAVETAGISIWKVAIISLLGSCLGQAGDLFESYLKRLAGVKDAGKIMPGHGGLLDRFDSHLFVAPFVFVAFSILFVLI